MYLVDLQEHGPVFRSVLYGGCTLYGVHGILILMFIAATEIIVVQVLVVVTMQCSIYRLMVRNIVGLDIHTGQLCAYFFAAVYSVPIHI